MAFTDFSDPNITTIIGLFTYANDVTSNWFALIMLAVLYMVSFVSMATRFTLNVVDAFAASSYIMLIITILFRVAGLVKDQIVMLAVVLAAVSLLLMVTKKGEDSG